MQCAKAQQVLVSRAHDYLIRRSSDTLKQYLPAKVQEASRHCCANSALARWPHVLHTTKLVSWSTP
jgi:hypothetical protein